MMIHGQRQVVLMEWKVLRGNTEGIWANGALIPMYRLSGGDVVLIDSGAREEPELLAELERRALRARAILCTHLHPDHIANNRAIVDRYGAEVFAHQREMETLEETYARLRITSELLGVPLPEVDHPVTTIGDVLFVEVDGVRFEVLHTPGHTDGHLSIVTPDGVCCLGDAVMSPDQLALARLPYLEDIDRGIATMEALRQTRYPLYVEAHLGITPPEGLDELVELNVQKELELYDALRAVITGPMEQEEVVTAFMQSLGLGRKAVGSPLMRHTAEMRVHALVNAGEYISEGSVIYPK